MLEDPSNTVWFFLGKDVDLIGIDPQLDLSVDVFSKTFTVYGIPHLASIDLTLRGRLGFEASAHLAYDTAGFRTGHLIDGFYVSQAYARVTADLDGRVGV